MPNNKVVLAYSGGLDTSVILKWLSNKGFEVVCFVGNVGQQEDFAAIEQKAIAIGAARVCTKDLREEFVRDYIFPALRGNALYEGRYLLATALARPLLAKAQIELAHAEGAGSVSHGATGKGNDQVRFELAYYALNPNINVISPWKEKEFLAQFRGRTDLLNYAEEWGIPVKASQAKPYSEDENIMHISHEAGVLEDPLLRPEEHVFSWTKAISETPDTEEIIEIEFKNGNPVKVTNRLDGSVQETSLALYAALNELGKKHGIGRVDMVENRYIGIKSRGVYESPAATILWAAHRDLEGLAMDKEVTHLRDMLIPKFSELIYNGFWFSPEMDFIMSAFDKSQEAIDGTVVISLFKGNVTVIGRQSPTSLYDPELSSMEVEGGFDATDSMGFININAIRLKAHHLVLHRGRPYKWRK